MGQATTGMYLLSCCLQGMLNSPAITQKMFVMAQLHLPACYSQFERIALHTTVMKQESSIMDERECAECR